MHVILMAGAMNSALVNAGRQMLAVFSIFSQAAAPAAVAALWQGAAVAVALVLSLRLAPRVSAAHRFALWAAGFAVVACLPFLPLMAQAAAPAVLPASPAPGAAIKPWLALDSRWGLIIAALWLAASAFRAVQFLLHAMRLRKLWKTATPIHNHALAASLAAAVKTRRPVAVCSTRLLDRPSVIGFFAPRVLIPDWLLERLAPQELQQVVLHEVEHLRRRDDWTNLLQKLSLVLFPLNPALAWIERRLCREREMACDEGVVRRTRAPRAYAACLASLAERSLARRAEALVLGAFGRRPELVRRVHSLLRRQRMLHPVTARALLGVVGCGLLLASVEMARCPQTVAFVAPQKMHAPDPRSAQPQRETARSVRPADLPTAPALAVARNASDFRAIETSAVLPVNLSERAPIASARRAADQPQQQVALLNSNARQPRHFLLRTEIANEDQASAGETQPEPQYVVLTAWERVGACHHRGRHFADYDAGAPNPEQAGAAKDGAEAGTPVRVTVVHMILEVYPASAAPVPAPGSQKEPQSHAVQSAAPTPDDGWLVFQL